MITLDQKHSETCLSYLFDYISCLKKQIEKMHDDNQILRDNVEMYIKQRDYFESDRNRHFQRAESIIQELKKMRKQVQASVNAEKCGPGRRKGSKNKSKGAK